jgi:competence protein ComEC
MRRPFLFIAAAFSLGILSQGLLDIPVLYILGFFVTALFLSALFAGSQRPFVILALASFMFLGALDYRVFYLLPKNHIKNIADARPDPSENCFVQGMVADRPYKSLTIFKQEKTDFLLNVEAVRTGDAWQRGSGVLSVQVFNPESDFRYGQRVILEGELARPRPAANPGQFDYRKFLERKKIFYTLKVRGGNFSKVTGGSGKNFIKRFAYRVSGRLERLINEYAPPREASILNAILLGQRQEIEGDINDNFINTGTVHILSISGLHVGLLAFIFLILLDVFRVPFKVSAAIMAVLLVFYSIMVGNSPPVVRATAMILTFMLGRVLKKEQDNLNSLSFSAAAILFFNPQDLFDIGFQLSFLTMGAIIYMPAKLEKMFNIKSGSYLRTAAIVSFSAWLWSAPFIARYFNIVSPVTLIANLVVVPLMFFVLASSVAFICLGVISPVFALIFSEVANLSILALLKTVSFFSGLPFSYFRIKSPPWLFIAAFYIFTILFFERNRLKLKAKYFLITMLVFLNIFIWHAALYNRGDILEITFLDVGKGDAIFVEFPGGGTMLIDGGEALGADMGRLVASRFLAYKGVNKIDIVAATHPHTDHVGGLAAVLKNFKVRYFLDNGGYEDNTLYKKCQDVLRRRKIKRFIVKDNDAIKGFEGAGLLVLNPPPEEFGDSNNNSLVMKLARGKFSVLFCGDIKEEAAEGLSLRHKNELPSTVLKVPHHGGSLGAAADEFLERVKPEAAVISAGDRTINQGLLAALESAGARVYRTDTDGAIILKNKKDKYLLLKFLAL